jgi:hypothetical protein
MDRGHDIHETIVAYSVAIGIVTQDHVANGASAESFGDSKCWYDQLRQTLGSQHKNMTRQDKTRQDKTRQDKTRQDKTRQDKTRLDQTRPDKSRQDQARSDKTRQDQTRQTKRDKTRQKIKDQ